MEKVRIEGGRAIGVVLAGGEELRADWVISAADGHATHYDLLDGRYADQKIARAFDRLAPFPSYVQVSLGIARDLSAEPGLCIELLDEPLVVDPATKVAEVSFRIFHYDPGFAPRGKTAVTCVLPTGAFDYWLRLRHDSHERYQAEKERLADAVIAVLERRMPGVRAAIETVDVATPATVMRYTGNWKGSMEGWLLTPKTGTAALPTSIKALKGFRMIGQWVMAGGGLPSGVMTARAALRDICKQDGMPFLGG